MTWFIGSQGNNISGQTVTNHTHSEKIAAGDVTVKVTAAYLCIRTLNVCRNLIYGSNTGHFFLFDVGTLFCIVTWHNDDGIRQ